MNGAGMRLDPTAEEFWPSAGGMGGAPQPFPDHFPFLQTPVCYYPPPGQLAAPMGQSPVGAARGVALSSVPGHVSEVAVLRDMELFGAVREVQVVERRRAPASPDEEMVVVVHFCDVRDAQRAVAEVQAQHMRQQCRLGQQYSLFMRNNWPYPPPSPVPGPAMLMQSPVHEPGVVDGYAVWAVFTTAPMTGEGYQNQGTIVVFNIDPDIPSVHLADAFSIYGTVKEVREAPARRSYRFIEFFDVRDAARALAHMDGEYLYGKRLVIQFSRAGGQSKRLAGAASACTSSNHPSASSPSSSYLPTNRSGKGSRRDQDKSSKGEGRKSLKGAGKGRKVDSSFMFGEEFDVEECRTTVMIKNIPNKYSQKLLLNMLDNHCINSNEQIEQLVGEEEEPFSSYDFVYLPIDFNNKCNVGYGFVNMTSPQAAWRLYKSFHKQPWEVFNSRKICEVSYARLQGLEALREHFRNSKFACDTDEYLPVVFSPPRDGKQLTEPVAVVCHPPGDEKKPIDGEGDGSSSSPPPSSTSPYEGEGEDSEEAVSSTSECLSGLELMRLLNISSQDHQSQ